MKTLAVIILALLQSMLFSQNDSSEVYALPKMIILQKEKGNEVLYNFEKNINKFTLTDKSLIADTLRYRYSVDLSGIKRVHFANGSAFWNVAGITGAVGFAIGFLAGGFFTLQEHGPHEFHLNQAFAGGAIMGIPFALIGGLIGALSDNYDSYDLRDVKKDKRHEYFKKLFAKYRVRPYK